MSLFKSIFSGSLFTKPLIISIIFSVAVSIFAGWLWMDRENKSILFEKQSDSILRLTKELEEEKQQTQHLSSMLQALDEVNTSVRDNIDSKRKDKATTLKGIDNAIKETAGGGYDVPLPSDITSMLDEVCQRIRGSACETPP